MKKHLTHGDLKTDTETLVWGNGHLELTKRILEGKQESPLPYHDLVLYRQSDLIQAIDNAIAQAETLVLARAIDKLAAFEDGSFTLNDIRKMLRSLISASNDRLKEKQRLLEERNSWEEAQVVLDEYAQAKKDEPPVGFDAANLRVGAPK